MKYKTRYELYINGIYKDSFNSYSVAGYYGHQEQRQNQYTQIDIRKTNKAPRA